MSTPVLAVDTGGTFTDLILLADGEISTLKVPSTPEDPASAVLDGIRRILGPRMRGFRLVHGSTVATNALLERKGGRVVLVTNEGFEDVLEIGRQDRPQLYALTGHRPPPLVEREDRLGIPCRLEPDGSERAPLDADDLAGLAERVRGADAVAVVLLHSYANPEHEERVGRAVEGLGVPISLSSVILPEFREFERTATTVVNAYVAPRVESYLSRLGDESGAERIRIMGSNGGALPLRRAAREPVHTILSGPAGGVVGAMDWGRRSGIERLLSFDMGGTSTDVSLVDGAPKHTREGRIGDLPVAIPLLDIHTVGAGGGSIASIDAGGVLHVGPDSAGADPGPIAYGRGGGRVTVTDAHVWLGRLPVHAFLGGEKRLERDAIAGPLRELANRAGRSADEVAEGILSVVDTAMEGALRVISVERGVDPSDFHLVAFGGAAGLHAAALSERLGLRGVLVPPDPGLLSAYGMLVAPVVRDRSRTVLLSSDDEGSDRRIHEVLDQLEAEARGEMIREGAAAADLSATRRVDARYRGQSFELAVAAADWVEGFHRAHQERYGYRRTGPIEAVTLRVRVRAPGETVRVRRVDGGGEGRDEGTGPDIPHERVDVRIGGEAVSTILVERSRIPPGRSIAGPAIVAEYSSTTWCPPGWAVARDQWGSLRLTPAGDGERTSDAAPTG